MRHFNITVNGNLYQVAVEEVAAGAVRPMAAPMPVAAPVAPVAAPAPVAQPAPVAAPVEQAAPAPAQAGSEGSVKVSAPMPGKIIGIKAKVGDAVKRGDVVVVLEAMKMENEIVAPSDGVIASINVSVNQTVDPGDVIATLN